MTDNEIITTQEAEFGEAGKEYVDPLADILAEQEEE